MLYCCKLSDPRYRLHPFPSESLGAACLYLSPRMHDTLSLFRVVNETAYMYLVAWVFVSLYLLGGTYLPHPSLFYKICVSIPLVCLFFVACIIRSGRMSSSPTPKGREKTAPKAWKKRPESVSRTAPRGRLYRQTGAREEEEGRKAQAAGLRWWWTWGIIRRKRRIAPLGRSCGHLARRTACRRDISTRPARRRLR